MINFLGEKVSGAKVSGAKVSGAKVSGEKVALYPHYSIILAGSRWRWRLDTELSINN